MTDQKKLDEYREINRLQAQIIHESQRKKVPCREYKNADIEYIEKLERALDKACIFLALNIDDTESVMSTLDVEKWNFKSEEDAEDFIEEAGKENVKRFMFDVWD